MFVKSYAIHFEVRYFISSRRKVLYCMAVCRNGRGWDGKRERERKAKTKRRAGKEWERKKEQNDATYDVICCKVKTKQKIINILTPCTHANYFPCFWPIKEWTWRAKDQLRMTETRERMEMKEEKEGEEEGGGSLKR